MKNFPLLAPVLALVLAGLLACSGGDDDGLPLYTPVPVNSEINGFVSITTADVKTPAAKTALSVAGLPIKAVGIDNPNAASLAGGVIKGDTTYSLLVSGFPGTPVFLYVESGGVWKKLGQTAITGDRVRLDITKDWKTVTVRGSTSEYKENGAAAAVENVKIATAPDYYAGFLVGEDLTVGTGNPYAIDVLVPEIETTYYLFVDKGMGGISLPVNAGELQISPSVGADIVKNIDKDLELTKITGTIAYTVDATDAAYTGAIVAGSFPVLSRETIIGFGLPTDRRIPTAYEVNIIRRPAPATVYFFAYSSGSLEDAAFIGSVEAGTAAAVPGRNLSCSVTGITSISGTIGYTKNGAPQPLSGGEAVYIVDAQGGLAGQGIVSGSPAAYSVSISRPAAPAVYYALLLVEGVMVKGDEVSVENTAVKTQNLSFIRTTSAIAGKIGGSGVSAVDVSGELLVSTAPEGPDDPDNRDKILGTAGLTYGSPYTYNGEITQPEAPVKAYYHVRDSLGVYYKIGEVDLEAGKPSYAKDFIIGLLNKRIVPGV